MAFQPGHKKIGGRKKGTPNKFPLQVKEAVRQAFEEAGGVDYLLRVAHDDPRTFMTIVGKLIPTEVSADLTSSDGTMTPVTIELLGVDSDESTD